MSQENKEVLSPLQKKMLYATTIVLWLSGMAWLYVRYCIQSQDEFGPQSYTTQSMLLKIHGAAAIIFFIVFGILLYHINPGWRQQHQRPSGVSLLVSCGLLILSGWGLYYLGNEQWRNLASWIHVILGFLLPVIIVFHVWRIFRARKSSTVSKQN